MGHRMTITVDEGLVQDVKRALCVKTGSEAIRIALEDVLRRKRLEEALAHRGKIRLAIDRKSLLKLRAEG